MVFPLVSMKWSITPISTIARECYSSEEPVKKISTTLLPPCSMHSSLLLTSINFLPHVHTYPPRVSFFAHEFSPPCSYISPQGSLLCAVFYRRSAVVRVCAESSQSSVRPHERDPVGKKCMLSPCDGVRNAFIWFVTVFAIRQFNVLRDPPAHGRLCCPRWIIVSLFWQAKQLIHTNYSY